MKAFSFQISDFGFRISRLCGWLILTALCAAGCAHRPGACERRAGDEIVAAGQFFHTGTKVVLWMDPGGYDAYRMDKRFGPLAQAGWNDSTNHPVSPNRYDLRKSGLTDAEIERFRGGGWDLAALRRVVDQFVIHYDAAGTSRNCFRVLQDASGLSVHFLLDLDGTIYQTLDLKERAWHATTSNSRSVGVEIANLGAYPTTAPGPLKEWYQKDAQGRTFIAVPARFGANLDYAPGFVARPVRRGPVVGTVQGRVLEQYDLTRQQYAALTQLTAALCAVFPKIRCAVPRDASGHPLDHKLPEDQLQNYHGILGHFQLQVNKLDPGPAFQWDYVIDESRRLLGVRYPIPPRLISDNK